MSAPELDLLDGDFYVEDPYSTYARLRREQPIAWDSVNELWGVFRYDDIVEIERRKDLWSSADTAKGGYRPNLPADNAIIGLDDPAHSMRRNLVARRFTPRAVADKEQRVRDVVTRLLDAALERGEVEIIEDLASPLPAMMIGWLLGYPEEEWRNLRDWSERTIALGGGPRYVNELGLQAYMEFREATTKVYEEKKGCPADDILSHYTQTTIPGYEFGFEEAMSDALLILDGGAETTRTVIGRTLLNLAAHPEQWAKLKAGADLTVATEEFIRFVTPVHNMCRVAKQDVEIGGVTVKQGQQVVLMYGSANRDETHFDDPETFDVTRTSNHHIAFGFGTHFCLGASLARLEIRTFFEEFLRRVESYEIVADSVVDMPNAFVFGLKSAGIRLTPA